MEKSQGARGVVPKRRARSISRRIDRESNKNHEKPRG